MWLSTLNCPSRLLSISSDLWNSSFALDFSWNFCEQYSEHVHKIAGTLCEVYLLYENGLHKSVDSKPHLNKPCKFRRNAFPIKSAYKQLLTKIHKGIQFFVWYQWIFGVFLRRLLLLQRAPFTLSWFRCLACMLRVLHTNVYLASGDVSELN